MILDCEIFFLIALHTKKLHLYLMVASVSERLCQSVKKSAKATLDCYVTPFERNLIIFEMDAALSIQTFITISHVVCITVRCVLTHCSMFSYAFPFTSRGQILAKTTKTIDIDSMC